MSLKNENYISQIIFKGSSKDHKNEKKSIFQDHIIESVTIPRDPRLAFWLRRRKRENGSERTFVAPPRPLRFRSLPPYLLPTLYALPAIIGNMMRVLMKKYIEQASGLVLCIWAPCSCPAPTCLRRPFQVWFLYIIKVLCFDVYVCLCKFASFPSTHRLKIFSTQLFKPPLTK